METFASLLLLLTYRYTAQRAATPPVCPAHRHPIDHRVYSGFSFNKALTEFKVKMTRLLPLNTIAAEAPITAKKGEYSGLEADILLFWHVQDTKTKDRKGRRLQSRRLRFQRRSILG